MRISNLNIGFNSSATLIGNCTYEITGDMSAVITDDYFNTKHTISIERLMVIYYHDGLFKDTIKEDGEPDALRIFRDTEVHANMDNGTEFDGDDYDENGYYEVALHHDNALNIYAYFLYGDESCY